MVEKGKEQQPSEDTVPENVETPAAELEESVDAAFEQAKPAPEEQEPELDEEGTPVEEPELDEEGNPLVEPELDEEGNPVEVEEPEESTPKQEHKGVFSEQGLKIFQARVGKEKTKRVKAETELATATATIEQLQKDADPNTKAVAMAGLDPQFIGTDDAATIAGARALEQKLDFYEDISRDPDGWEDPKDGKIWQQGEITAQFVRVSNDRTNQQLLAKAATIREAAQARQSEVIAAGLKALAEQARQADALKKKKAPSRTAPNAAPRSASPAPSHAPAAPGKLDVRRLEKGGRTAETLSEIF